jgi:predicted DNA-binding transcriptional regulator YafY
MYHPTGRVLTVLELLQSRPGLTGPEIAARLETDVRTVRRYVTKLQDVGIPVEATPGRYGGYRLRPGYKLPPLIFSEEEATAIVLGLLGSSWLEVGQSQAAVEGAMSKITRVLPPNARDRVQAISSVMIFSPYGQSPKPDASLLILLSESVQSRQCVRMNYQSQVETTMNRVVEPYGLVGRQGKWYLVGYCRLRRDYRTFRLDRMSSVSPLPEVFARDEGFDFRAYAIEHLENYPVKWKITIRFEHPLAVLQKKLPASLGELTEREDGVRLVWPTDDLDYAAHYLLGLGLRFVVVDPPELRDSLRGLAREADRIASLPA